MQTKEAVRLALKEAIMAGRYAIGDKLPTEQALLTQFDISRYSLRQALKALADEGLIRAVQGSGFYVADPRNKQRKQAARKIIGVITTHLADYIFPPIISGIDSVVSEAGYGLMLSNTHNEFENEQRSLIRMMDTGVAGLIIEPTRSAMANPNLALYRRIALAGIPVVFINAGYTGLTDFPTLTVDDAGGERQLIETLLKQGHRQILGLFQIDDQQGVDRMQGFVQAYQANQPTLSTGNVMLYQSGDHLADLKARILDVVNGDSRPTAIACYNDQLAIRLISWLGEAGIKVPDDISLVGFDDYEMSRYSRPGLTTAVHPKRRMGEAAGRAVLQAIAHQTPASIQYPAELVMRRSIKKLS
ncbi:MULTISPECIES: GntR family transcriptional regulator [unclassified Lacticaseibacillus]|uniref:GntR family transcriptional regulator n=1 Tax=unclassified Lacticaseibacillus TaxID=2759744 RepID=UPI001944B15C|nr:MULTISPECIES: GntR family transcriptional regulator [unclassified Lacticaseibacillus]